VCFSFVFWKKFIIAAKYEDVKNRNLSISGDAILNAYFVRWFEQLSE